VRRLGGFNARANAVGNSCCVQIFAVRRVEGEESQLQFSVRDESDDITNPLAIREPIPPRAVDRAVPALLATTVRAPVWWRLAMAHPDDSTRSQATTRGL
jgi:hypothetical protein